MRHLKAALAMCAAAALSACGGSDGGSGGGVVVVPTPTPTPTPTGTSNPAGTSSTDFVGALAQAEASGAIPKLDTSSSLTGIDANTDGVRDDLAIWIASRPITEPQRAALRQAAKAYSSAVTAGSLDNQSASEAANTKLTRAIACIYLKFPKEPDPAAAGTAVTEMREYSANTRPRAYAFLRFSASMSGSVISIPGGDTCE